MIKRFVVTSQRYRSFSTAKQKCEFKKEVRVRFAPSPTGHIHLGGLRTALYNYIFAKQNKGSFILRIEDTDQSRVVPGTEQEIEQILITFGLKPDESPTVQGKFGPYVQSQRLKLYKQRSEELIESGRAYRCFCSPERLDLLRRYQLKNREKPRYDGKCRNLSREEVNAKILENNGKHVIRFAIKPEVTRFADLIFGEISNDFSTMKESDPVLLKSDGYPTYHFANVVDDREMKMSHILRGSEWISSTAKHIQIYQAFGWEAPRFAHFPLITLKGGNKISKRNNENHVSTMIGNGYRPRAILNFLTNMGGGVPKEKQDSLELWDLDRIVEEFDFGKVLCHSGSIDIIKLQIYNTKDIQRRWVDDKEGSIAEVRQLLRSNGIATDLDDSSLKMIIQQFIDRPIITFNDLMRQENSFIWHYPTMNWSLKEYHDKGWNLNDIVNNIITLVKETDMDDKAEVDGGFREVAIKLGIEYAKLMRLTRKLLTNSEEGLPVHQLFMCLGKERSLSYLHKSLKYVN